MSDPIDRQAVLSIICGNCDYYDENESQYDRVKGLPSLHHLCDGCKHKGDQNKIEYGKVSPCIFCIRSAHDNYEREDADENTSQEAGT